MIYNSKCIGCGEFVRHQALCGDCSSSLKEHKIEHNPFGTGLQKHPAS